ncbi:hypothetical protein H4582DRAFT_2091110 [Lactarius indigo]|nr:hypothetical protein H4582DRAFT_2091110 [Lactarius indigo]
MASRTVAALASSPPPPPTTSREPSTHFRVTLRRSGISLGKRARGTLAMKELIEVENVPASWVTVTVYVRREFSCRRGSSGRPEGALIDALYTNQPLSSLALPRLAPIKKFTESVEDGIHNAHIITSHFTIAISSESSSREQRSWLDVRSSDPAGPQQKTRSSTGHDLGNFDTDVVLWSRSFLEVSPRRGEQ